MQKWLLVNTWDNYHDEYETKDEVLDALRRAIIENSEDIRIFELYNSQGKQVELHFEIKIGDEIEEDSLDDVFP